MTPKTETLTVEQELLDLTGGKARTKKEKPDDYRARLAQAADDALTDTDWAKLSEEAQAWVNETIEALNAKEPVPEFPSVEAEDEAAEDEAAEEEAAEEAPTPARKPKPKAAASRAAAPAGKPSASTRLRELIVQHPMWPLPRLEEKMKAEGYQPARASVDVVYYDTLSVLKALKARGMIDVELPETRRGRKPAPVAKTAKKTPVGKTASKRAKTNKKVAKV